MFFEEVFRCSGVACVFFDNTLTLGPLAFGAHKFPEGFLPLLLFHHFFAQASLFRLRRGCFFSCAHLCFPFFLADSKDSHCGPLH